MQTKIKVKIPKGFFEDKTSVTLDEMLEMFTEMVKQVKKLEEDLEGEKLMNSIYIKENKELKNQLKQGGKL